MPLVAQERRQDLRILLVNLDDRDKQVAKRRVRTRVERGQKSVRLLNNQRIALVRGYDFPKKITAVVVLKKRSNIREDRVIPGSAPVGDLLVDSADESNAASIFEKDWEGLRSSTRNHSSVRRPL
jgi:hypothetical protein